MIIDLKKNRLFYINNNHYINKKALDKAKKTRIVM